MCCKISRSYFKVIFFLRFLLIRPDYLAKIMNNKCQLHFFSKQLVLHNEDPIILRPYNSWWKNLEEIKPTFCIRNLCPTHFAMLFTLPPSRRKYSAKAHSQITTHSLHTHTHHEIYQKVVDCVHIIVCDGLRFAREQVIWAKQQLSSPILPFSSAICEQKNNVRIGLWRISTNNRSCAKPQKAAS